MELSGDILRGHTDAIILSILEKEDDYGYNINNKILEISNQLFSLTEATLYTTFKRLEKLEFIKSYWRMGNNNVKRKYYKITLKGINFLVEHRLGWEVSKGIINKFLEDCNEK